MSGMTHRDRLLVYGIGFALGCVVLMILGGFKQRARDQRAETPAAVAPYIENINRDPAPLQGRYLVQERQPQDPGETFVRELLFESREPGQWVWLKEHTRRYGGWRGDLVERREWYRADVLLVTLHPGISTATLTEALRPHGYRLQRPTGNAREYLLEVGPPDLDSVPRALAHLHTLPDLVETAHPLPFTGL